MATMLPDVHDDDPWLVRLMREIDQVRLLIERVDSKIMPRSEIEAADAKRVLDETYKADMRAINDRFARIEGGSGRFIAWIGVIFGGMGCLGTIITALASAAGIIIALAHH